jgi:hypothetical protein
VGDQEAMSVQQQMMLRWSRVTIGSTQTRRHLRWIWMWNLQSAQMATLILMHLMLAIWTDGHFVTR